MGGGNGAAEDLEDAGPTNRNLRIRQKAVLNRLTRAIEQGHCAQLGLRESTANFDVRQIMRKFGVTNRTQVAFVYAKGAK